MFRSLARSFAVIAAVVVCFVSTADLTAESLSVGQASDPVNASATQTFPEVKDAFARFQNRDVEGTLAALKTAVERHPELPPVGVLMAQFYAATKQPIAAVRGWLEQSTLDNPDDPAAYIMLGRMALQENRTTEAELLFAKASQLLESFTNNETRKTTMQIATYGQLAQMAMKHKDWALARKNLEALLKLRDGDAATLRMLAETLFQEGNVDEAMNKLRDASDADKDLLSPECTMAMWYEEAGDRAKAGELMVEAINAKPKDFKTRLTAANWALQTQSFDQARQQAEIAMKLDPQSEMAKLLAGNVALFQKDYPAAIQYFKEVIAENPTNFTATNNIALALCEQGGEKNLKLAMQYANINTKLYPKMPEPFSTIGWVFFKTGNLDDAERALQHSANLGRTLRPDTAYYIANVYAERGRNEEARKLLQSALQTKSLFSEREDAQTLLDKLSQ